MKECNLALLLRLPCIRHLRRPLLFLAAGVVERFPVFRLEQVGVAVLVSVRLVKRHQACPGQPESAKFCRSAVFA